MRGAICHIPHIHICPTTVVRMCLQLLVRFDLLSYVAISGSWRALSSIFVCVLDVCVLLLLLLSERGVCGDLVTKGSRVALSVCLIVFFGASFLFSSRGYFRF